MRTICGNAETYDLRFAILWPQKKKKNSDHRYDLVTYCRFASQFLVCDTSAAFSICDGNPLHHFLSCALGQVFA